jgi:hypothetical protein
MSSHTLLTLCVQLINEKPQVIQEYENGKAIPNPQVGCRLSVSDANRGRAL